MLEDLGLEMAKLGIRVMTPFRVCLEDREELYEHITRVHRQISFSHRHRGWYFIISMLDCIVA